MEINFPFRKSSLLAAVVVIALAAILFIAPCRLTSVSITPITGSTVFSTTWFGFWNTTESHASPLREWCDKHRMSVAETAQFVGANDFTLMGDQLSCYLGARPAVYYFHQEMQAIFVSLASESEIRKFITEMSVADKERQRKLVEAALDRLILLETKTLSQHHPANLVISSA